MREAFCGQPTVLQFEWQEIEAVSDRRAVKRHHAVAACGKPSERAPVDAKRSAREIRGVIEKPINTDRLSGTEASKDRIRPIARPSDQVDRRLVIDVSSDVHDCANGTRRSRCRKVEHRIRENDDVMLNDRSR